MTIASILIPSIILPTSGIGTQTIDTVATYYSTSIPVEQLQEKKVQVYATAVGAPGALSIWVEIAPIDSALYYTQVAVPLILAATDSVIIPWTVHSVFARLAVDCASVAAGSWIVVGIVEAKNP